jgi:hypothetical protein
MSDVGIIVTGVVVGSASGIVGTICGAWLTARSQMAGLRFSISAEDQRSHVAAKRQIYAAFQASIENMLLTNARYAVAGDGAVQVEMPAEVHEALNTTYLKFAELRLIAPSSIERPAMAILAHFSTRNPDKEVWIAEYSRLQERCIQQMRADLGEPPLERLRP